MMMDEHKALQEIRERTTRIESRMCRIADHFGIKVGSPEKRIELGAVGEKAAIINIDAMDTSLSEITHFLTKHGIADKVAVVRFNGTLVATLHPLT